MMSCPPSHHTSPEPEIGPGSPLPPTISAFPEASDPKRVALIRQLFHMTQLSSVDSITWGLVWTADLRALEAMIAVSSIPYGMTMAKLQLITDRFPVIKDCMHSPKYLADAPKAKHSSSRAIKIPKLGSGKRR